MNRLWSALMLLLCAAGSTLAQTSVIDMRSREYPLPRNGEVKGAASPGLPQRTPLRVTVSVKDPSKIAFGAPFDFALLVENASKHDVSFPAVSWAELADKPSKDSVCVMTGITLSLFNDTKLVEKKFVTVFLFGSQEVPGATVLLKPGERLRILGKVAKVEGGVPFIKGHLYATLGTTRVWWNLPDGDRCNHEAKPFGIVESAAGPEVDLRRLPQ